ncbi:hypothetical protein [Mycolicibacterium gilvum]|uniref:hypothetical protein n=1 Tax=Mycolicibacterium gilvum TaxID=1804 RepID=UPI004045CF92
MIDLSRSTWHYRTNPRPPVSDPLPQKHRAYPSRIDEADRAVIRDKILAGWEAGSSVDHAFAASWDEGVMLASRRSWWRIAAAIGACQMVCVSPVSGRIAGRDDRQGCGFIAG